MTIEQTLPSVIGVEENYIFLSGVNDYVDVEYTLTGQEAKVYNFCYTTNDGNLEINVQEIAKLVYANLDSYTDPFDYTATKLYTETDNYHLIRLGVQITDPIDGVQNIDNITVINGVLQVGECEEWAEYIDLELSDNPLNVPFDFTGLNYDLNFDVP